VDVKKLKTSQIKKGLDSGQWIFINRQKTDSKSAIPLPTAVKLIEKYSKHPLCVNKDTPLPVPSNQKMNAKRADICSMNKPLTSHIARHTFATTVTLSMAKHFSTVFYPLQHLLPKNRPSRQKIVIRNL